MRIGFISTRLKGTDGVSLEVGKWTQVLRRMGHEIFFCAGELGGYADDGTLIPKLHFNHQSIVKLSRRAFDGQVEEDGEKLADEVQALTGPGEPDSGIDRLECHGIVGGVASGHEEGCVAVAPSQAAYGPPATAGRAARYHATVYEDQAGTLHFS